MSIKHGLELSTSSNVDYHHSAVAVSPEGASIENESSFDTQGLGSPVKDHRARTNDFSTECEDDLESTQPSRKRNQIVGPVWIGNIRCFLPNRNGRPLITIGPNWGFTIFLCCLVCGSLYTSISGLDGMIEHNAPWPYIVLGTLVIAGGLLTFFKTLLGDPGIPAEVYIKKARPFEQRSPMADHDEKGFPLCRTCEVYITENREHCDMCDVCIENLDHHCVFYSKCIGGGNVWYFRLSLVMFVMNMTYFFLVYGVMSLTAEHKDLLI